MIILISFFSSDIQLKVAEFSLCHLECKNYFYLIQLNSNKLKKYGYMDLILKHLPSRASLSDLKMNLLINFNE